MNLYRRLETMKSIAVVAVLAGNQALAAGA
jgi:hypothetical protein